MSEYWSGFYTTDPAFKRRVHDYTEITRSVASLASLHKFSSVKEQAETIKFMQMIQSINYHHDAITGTHFSAVGTWYDQNMLSALHKGDSLLDSIFSRAASIQGLYAADFEGCYQ